MNNEQESGDIRHLQSKMEEGRDSGNAKTELYKGKSEWDGNKNIRYFSMFTGVGGFELGLETSNSKSLPKVEQDWEGWNRSINEWGELLRTRSISTFCCIGMSEFDKYSNQILKYKFPTIKNWGDCTKINPNELPDFDMLCGGFPCQSFSIAGKRRGFEDTRGTMFFEISRILKVKRPKIILLENVKGLLNHDKGKTFRVILQTLDELGYEIQWVVLNSKFFGVPQNRERVFIIGNLRGECRPKILPFREDCGEIVENRTSQNIGTICAQYAKIPTDGSYINHPTITEAIGRQGSSSEYINSIKHIQQAKAQHSRIYDTEGVCPTLAGASKLSGDCTPKISAVLTPDRENKRQNGRRFKEPGEPSFTVTGQDIHGISDGCSIRRLTPTECCRLQSFPDDWNEYGIDEKGEKVKMSDTQRYKQMGNAVTTNVITAIGSQILNKTKEVEDGR